MEKSNPVFSSYMRPSKTWEILAQIVIERKDVDFAKHILHITLKLCTRKRSPLNIATDSYGIESLCHYLICYGKKEYLTLVFEVAKHILRILGKTICREVHNRCEILGFLNNVPESFDEELATQWVQRVQDDQCIYGSSDEYDSESEYGSSDSVRLQCRIEHWIQVLYSRFESFNRIAAYVSFPSKLSDSRLTTKEDSAKSTFLDSFISVSPIIDGSHAFEVLVQDISSVMKAECDKNLAKILPHVQHELDDSDTPRRTFSKLSEILIAAVSCKCKKKHAFQKFIQQKVLFMKAKTIREFLFGHPLDEHKDLVHVRYCEDDDRRLESVLTSIDYDFDWPILEPGEFKICHNVLHTVAFTIHCAEAGDNLGIICQTSNIDPILAFKLTKFLNPHARKMLHPLWPLKCGFLAVLSFKRI
eukprot:CAMPEP_0185254956 /NCGR_PEP_ID=MMETSP1359-20130426/3914_1 /TAXON_ID=552665 /ORGANISM="Bigelowiella longifila, Strain CCMP242" /LENGTH=416 /DNA_ID=CAMNT_0027838477 /DNA_START=269 /DNA_END=1519 /DNA_ORIENTATION=+